MCPTTPSDGAAQVHQPQPQPHHCKHLKVCLASSLPFMIRPISLDYPEDSLVDVDVVCWCVQQHHLMVQHKLALFDTLDFLLNEYFIELNTANFKILNRFLN